MSPINPEKYVTATTIEMRSAGTDAQEWAIEVMAAMSRLPAKQLEALSLVYGGRLTQAELAIKLGATLDQVKSLVATGMRALSGHLSAT